jgi:carboxyl-terminal processing protease
MLRPFLIIVWLVGALLGPAAAQSKLAFVAGINDYPNLAHDQQLQRAVNDAESVGDALQSLGFTVTRVTSGATLDNLIRRFSEFTHAVKPGDTVLFFFAGHGVALDDGNYLIPADVPDLSPSERELAKKRAIAERDIKRMILSAGARVAIVVLDACRDNPFPREGTRALGEATRGLMRQPTQGVYTLYSASEGQTALDRLTNDNGRNSVFTRVLIEKLVKPGLSLSQLGDEVRDEVAALAEREGHDQIPAFYNELRGSASVFLAGVPRPGAPITAPSSQGGSQLAAVPPTPPLPADLVTECDRQAASPYDPQRPQGVAGIAPGHIDIVPALAACNDAVGRYPGVARFAYQLGRVAYDQKDYARARDLFERAAAAGNAASMNNLGTLYSAGNGVTQDYAEARRWYEKSASMDLPIAMGNLGILYRDGKGVTQDYAEARRWFEKAAAAGDAGGMNNLGALYFNGQGVAQDYAEARRWYERSAALGNGVAMRNLGDLYRDGRSVAQDYAEARRWFEKAAAAGDAGGMNDLGRLYVNGQGVAQDYAEARRWYEKAAAAGSAFGMTNLGALYANGQGGAQDYAEARRWFEKSATLGNGAAMWQLGASYRDGKGVKQDYAEARRWFEKAAAVGDANGMNDLGILHYTGQGVAQDYAEARRWYEKAAAAGSAFGMSNLGALYANGQGGAQDYAEARRWYEKGAALGNGVAMRNLGDLYRDGKGVTKSLADARAWYEKAATANDAAAKDRLKELEASTSGSAAPTKSGGGVPPATYRNLNLFGDVLEHVRSSYVDKVDDHQLLLAAIEGMRKAVPSGGIAPLPDLPAGNADIYAQLSVLGDVFERLRFSGPEQPRDEKLILSAVNSMLASLDPHSGYLDDKSFQALQVQNRSNLGGLGIEVTLEDGMIKVVSAIEDTPGSRAGVLANDLITNIDDEAVQGLTLNQAIDKLRGPVNTRVKLRVMRKGHDAPIELTLTRDIIKGASVRSHSEGDDVGYIRITQFNEQTGTGLKKAIADIAAHDGNKLKGFILDLRNNPGGLLDQAVIVSNAFLNRGEIVSTRGRNPDQTQRFTARPGSDLAKGKPVIVLINGGSASASEIVAGALQDHKRATILGTRSFGAGSVQTTIPLGAGNGALRLTTARYFTPSGRSIQAEGIMPDIEVFQEIPDDLKKRADTKGKAALPGHLKAEPQEETGSQAYVPPSPTDDKALHAALDLIRGGQVHPAFPQRATHSTTR